MNAKAALIPLAALLLLGSVNAVAEAVTGHPLFDGGTTSASTPDTATPEHQEKASGTWTAPTTGAVTTVYGVKNARLWSKGYHTGIDFPVPTGTQVKAASTGTVVSVGWGGRYGTQIVIKHTNGIYTQYAHLSRTYVQTGAHVTTGMPIALSGSSGNSTGAHLHFEVRTGPGFGSDINPTTFLAKRGVTP